MNKIIKIFISIAALGLIVSLAIIIILPFVFDLNDYKDEISKAVKEQTGREFNIKGDIDLSIFPWLGAEIGAMEIKNAEGFGKEPFAAIESARVAVKLVPLLSKEVEIDTLTFKGLYLNLVKNSKGKTNWDDLISNKKEAKKSEGAKKAREKGTLALAAFSAGGINISDSNLSWIDESTGSEYSMNNINLQTGEFAFGKPVDIELKLDLKSVKPKIGGNVSLSTRLSFNDAFNKFELLKTSFNSNMKGDVVPEGLENFQLKLDIAVDMASQSLKVSGLNMQTLGLNVDGEINGERIIDDPEFKGAIKISAFNIKELIKKLKSTAPETSDPSALSRFAADMNFSASKRNISLNVNKINIDDSTLKGTLNVINLSKPAIKYDFSLDKIDLDRYLPPQAKEKKETAAANNKVDNNAAKVTDRKAGKTESPLAAIGALNMNGNFKIGSLKAANLNFSDLLVTISADSGLVKLHPIKAHLYDGDYSGNIQLDARKSSPKISLNENLTGINIGPLLKDLTGKDLIDGKANLQLQLTSSGISPEGIKKALNGNVSFHFTDGAVKGVDIVGKIRNAMALLKGGQAKNEGPEKTDFSSIEGTAVIDNGVVLNKDFVAESPLLRVAGAGKVDLTQETINYLIKAKIVATLQGQGGEGMEELVGLTVPIRIHNTFSDPKYKIDLQSLLKSKAKDEVKNLLIKSLGNKMPGSETPESGEASEGNSKSKLPFELPGGDSDDLKGKLKKSPFGGLFN